MPYGCDIFFDVLYLIYSGMNELDNKQKCSNKDLTNVLFLQFL